MKTIATLAALAVAAHGQILPIGYAGAPIAAGPALQYAAAPALQYAAAPAIQYTHAAPAVQIPAAAPAIQYAAAPIAAPVAAPVPVVPKQYAVPAPKTVNEAPIVQEYTEPVEQHGYKIKY